jgi:hypothetical protein
MPNNILIRAGFIGVFSSGIILSLPIAWGYSPCNIKFEQMLALTGCTFLVTSGIQGVFHGNFFPLKHARVSGIIGGCLYLCAYMRIVNKEKKYYKKDK